MRLFLLTLTLCGLSISIHAEDAISKMARVARTLKDQCHPQDYRDRVPIQGANSTGDLGWCYTNVAANLASFATGRSVSSVDVGITYGADRGSRVNAMVTPISPNLTETGFVAQAFNDANKKGFCDSTNVQIPDPSTYKEDVVALDTKLSKMGSDCVMDPQGWALVSGFFPNVRALAHTLRPIVNKGIETMADSACGKRFSVKAVQAVEHPWGTQEYDRMLSLQKELNEGRIVGIQLNFNPLLKGGIEKELKSLFSFSADQPEHALTVVGQQWNDTTHQCDMILRGSWGKECSFYRPEITHCDPATGDLSVPASSLSTLITRDTTLLFDAPWK